MKFFEDKTKECMCMHKNYYKEVQKRPKKQRTDRQNREKERNKKHNKQ